MTAWKWVGVLVLCCVASAPSITSAQTSAGLPEGAEYVALGSSYAAGPGITIVATDSPAGCSQSQDNYARQLARMRNLRLVDRSCGGATAKNILHAGQFGQPRQMDAVTSETRLVTITIGGNDVRYTIDLRAAVCRSHPEAIPAATASEACSAMPNLVLADAFATLAIEIREIARQVRQRAPQARLVFVDYATVLPAGPPCPALAISTQDADELSKRAERLAALTEEVAKEAGADLIKASELTRGHNACAADPWVAGWVPRRPGAPAAFHPKLQAMTAIADALDRKLRR